MVGGKSVKDIQEVGRVARMYGFICFGPNRSLAVWNSAEESKEQPFVFMLKPGGWRYPQHCVIDAMARPVRKPEQGRPRWELYYHFPLAAGERWWGIAVPSEDKYQANPDRHDYPNVLMSKLDDNRFDDIRRVVRPWAYAPESVFPRLLGDATKGGTLKEEQLDELLTLKRKLFQGERDLPARPLNTWMRPSPFEPAVKGFAKFCYSHLSMNHNCNSWNIMIEMWDKLAGAGNLLTVEEHEFARAAIAFFIHKATSPTWWPAWRMKFGPDHPESIMKLFGIETTPAVWYGCSNQNVDRYMAIGQAALLIPNHPRYHEWMEHVLWNFRADMQDSPLQNGVWPEGTRYAFFNFNNWLYFSEVLRHNKIADFFVDPYFKNQIDYARKIISPPDPRFKNQTMMAPIGDADDRPDMNQNIFWAAAHAYKLLDARFAGELMWQWQRSGDSGPIYRDKLLSYYQGEIEPVEPKMASEEIRGFGAVMRSRYNTPRETFFLIKNSLASQHWHRDELGFHYYGLGKPLLTDPGGYYGMCLESNHNVVRFYGRSSWNRGVPRKWVTLEQNGDLFVGEVTKRNFAQEPVYVVPSDLRTPAHWSRHIMFVKPDYFVIYDQIQSICSSDLFLQAIASEWKQEGNTIAFKGKSGVDFDCTFLKPTKPEAKQAISKGKPFNHPYGRSVMLSNAADRDYFWVIYPYGKSGDRARIEPLPGVNGAKVTIGARTDYVFLSPRSLDYRAGKVRFRGRAGFVAVEGDRVRVTILDGRSAAAGRYRVKATSAPVAVAFGGDTARIESNGDGCLLEFRAGAKSASVGLPGGAVTGVHPLK